MLRWLGHNASREGEPLRQVQTLEGAALNRPLVPSPQPYVGPTAPFRVAVVGRVSSRLPGDPPKKGR